MTKSIRLARQRAVTVLLSTAAVGACAAACAVPRAAAEATPNSTCTASATWIDQGLTADDNVDSCNTAMRLTGACAFSSIQGNTVYDAGDQFGITTQAFENWAEACENSGAIPILYLLFQERGTWYTIASEAQGGGGKTHTYKRTWTAR